MESTVSKPRAQPRGLWRPLSCEGMAGTVVLRVTAGVRFLTLAGSVTPRSQTPVISHRRPYSKDERRARRVTEPTWTKSVELMSLVK